MKHEYITVAHSEIHSFIQNKYKDGFNYLLDITAIDYTEYIDTHEEEYSVIYIIRHKDFKLHVVIKTYLPTLEIDSITDIFSGANWLEREVYDQYGVIFTNHPNLRRVLNHREFVGHPLRKSYPITKGQLLYETDDLVDEMNNRLLSKEVVCSLEDGSFSECNKDLMFLNLGPSHPASHGTIRTYVALDGETIEAAVSEIGYLHRGFEKSCENHTYNQIVPYTDRLNYCSAISNNIAFVKTVEDMLGVTLSERAQAIRVMLLELSRVEDHIVCLAAVLVDMGGLTNYWYMYNPREDIYDLLSKLTGARLTNSFMRVGGMANDLYDGFDEDLKEVIKKVQYGVNETLKLIKHNKIFHDRTQNVGVISAEDAINASMTGPNLRASGVSFDMRKDTPYYGYEKYEFDVIVGSVGDVYDRVMVRYAEIDESIKIIEQVMQNLPEGDVNIKDASITLPTKEAAYTTIEGAMNQFKLIYEGVKVPAKEYYGSLEATNGELGFFIVSDGSGTPYKVKVKAPSFTAMSAYPQMVEGSQLADAILTLGSLNIIAGEMDR
ncbi:NADH dehydrogenase (quinone) subunit D [Candidatus Sulfurimonas marisnigri]|uniref:NADH dehydrogenase (Quinone) subunit D n=1 Tax=Candidatus Sulfurimonas marisnigri TaxID=2740405 RepID=A0A7S7RQ56_9BACT|nr:NADH dehydrogenase (quinone) subunit D [Candidatus Sulfurimonas marisnigri]QOY54341.1 NADH dehydrogenase (quinone) subunit D [Candidatus Sulfurimonas marisnigri]